MAEKKKPRGEPFVVVRPPKKVSEMTDEERKAFARSIADRIFERAGGSGMERTEEQDETS